MAAKDFDEVLKTHPYIEKVEGRPGLRRLSGYVGKPPSNKVVRIYRSFALDEYWEVARSDIVSARTVERSDGCVTLLIHRDAKVVHAINRPADEHSRNPLEGELLEAARALAGGSLARTPVTAAGWWITIATVTIIMQPNPPRDPTPPDDGDPPV